MSVESELLGIANWIILIYILTDCIPISLICIKFDCDWETAECIIQQIKGQGLEEI